MEREKKNIIENKYLYMKNSNVVENIYKCVFHSCSSTFFPHFIRILRIVGKNKYQFYDLFF